MRSNQVAVVGAAETTELGVIPNASQLQLHADAALNAIADAGLKLSDIDGFATAVETPQQVCHYLGIKPTWADGTSSRVRSRLVPRVPRPITPTRTGRAPAALSTTRPCDRARPAAAEQPRKRRRLIGIGGIASLPRHSGRGR